MPASLVRLFDRFGSDVLRLACYLTEPVFYNRYVK